MIKFPISNKKLGTRRYKCTKCTELDINKDDVLSPTPQIEDQMDIAALDYSMYTNVEHENKFYNETHENIVTSFKVKSSYNGIKRTYVLQEKTIRTLQHLKTLYPIRSTYDEIVADAV